MPSCKSQEIIVEADCSNGGKQRVCISSSGKRDLEKRDGEGNDWPPSDIVTAQ